MGLFKRRDETRNELEALRAELTTMRERLDQSETAKQRLAENLGRVEAEHARLTTQVGAVESKVGAVETKVVTVASSIEPAINDAIGTAASTDDVESVRDELARLSTLASQVDELSTALSEQRSTLPPPLVPPDHSDDDEVLAVLQQQLDQLAEVIARQHEHIADIAIVATDTAERTDTSLVEMRATLDATVARQHEVVDTETRTDVGLLAEKVGAIESRVNQVSLELTNQLTELSGDIDRAGAHADPSDLLDDLVARLDEVTGGQERLANEQARYAIQFREDLAELADRLRRPGTR